MFPALNWPDFQPMRSDGQLQEILSTLEESGLYINEHFADLKDIAALKQYAERKSNENQFRESSIGKNVMTQKNLDIRSDTILWVDQFTGAMQTIGLWLENLSGELKNHFRVNISKIESHFSIYPPGSHYDKHKDNSADHVERQFTFIYYLNSEWQEGDGGELAIYDPLDKNVRKQTVAPKAGTFVLFRSDMFFHEVLKSNSTRYTYTGWFRR